MCTDINECEDKNELNQDVCGGKGNCINLPGKYKCRCRRGYEFYQGTCVKKNPCRHGDKCSSKGEGFKCKPISTRRYQCVCDRGYSYDRSTKTCNNLNECEILSYKYKHDPSRTCVDLPGTFSFRCAAGYEGDGENCSDIDECSLPNSDDLCPDGRVCVNTVGSYTCECSDRNYKLDAETEECVVNCEVYDLGTPCVSEDPELGCVCDSGYQNICDRCVDINECKPIEGEVNASVCDQICQNTEGGYECSCFTGFAYNGTQCIDVDECSDESLFDCQIHANCVNTVGSYTCECANGFIFDEATETCQDIDECTNNNCSQICRNTLGSYLCECHPGYIQDPEDQFKCLVDDPCVQIDCSRLPNGVCHKGECICRAGFNSLYIHFNTDYGDPEDLVNSPTQHHGQKLCVDIDECKMATQNQISLCNSEISECVNLQGGYMCACSEGFKNVANSNNLLCEDIDECSEFQANSTSLLLHDCHQNCVNFDGGFECECFTGYRFAEDEKTCIDIDECSEDEKACPPHSTCENTQGSHVCICHAGYIMNEDGLCVDLDECQFEETCQQVCENTIGSFVCSCYDGFSINSNNTSLCDDINECSDPVLNGCQEYEDCTNLVPFYECSCKHGFYLIEDKNITVPLDQFYNNTETRCKDIDECADTRHNLCPDKNEQCYNTPGSYTCDCSPGFKFFRMTETCEDFNECLEEPDRCGKDAVCVNTVGNFRCDGCFPSCIDGKNTCTVIGEKQWRCNCDAGWWDANPDGEFSDCQDINECETMDIQCPDTKVCINLPGSYKCDCPPHYEFDTETNLCFLPPCWDGYRRNETSLACVDINECEESQPCDYLGYSTCVNHEGSFECKCNEGYQPGFNFNGTDACVDIDECVEQIHNCHKSEICHNLWPHENKKGMKYDCVCEEGWEAKIEYFNSTDTNTTASYNEEGISEEEKRGRVKHWCELVVCGPGYTKEGIECFDIDECNIIDYTTWDITENGKQYFNKFCHKTASCTNSIGSYDCHCNSGYVFANLDDPLHSECVDIDECENDSHDCLATTQVCLNKKGGYDCVCAPGYQPVTNNSTVLECEDVDECSDSRLNLCDESAICQNEIGDYTCVCPDGLRIDAKTNEASNTSL